MDVGSIMSVSAISMCGQIQCILSLIRVCVVSSGVLLGVTKFDIVRFLNLLPFGDLKRHLRGTIVIVRYVFGKIKQDLFGVS